jgi:hypothetical protein
MVIAIASEYREQYEVDSDDTITSPGIFQGEHISIPYFWDCIQNGDCESVYDVGMVVHFIVIGDSERDEFPDLKDRYGVIFAVTETDIHTTWCESKGDFQELKDNPITKV